MKVTSKLGVALLTTAALIAIAAPASAQSQGDDDASASSDEGGGNVIVVTAQRREENLQDVPISVSVIGREEIRDKDISDVSRLEQVVPGLRLNQTGSAQRPAIRGVYTETIGVNSDPRIGFYIDEIYQSRPQQATAALVDLARVEVQKGPQGTLFGRNSFGGNIALTTAEPVDYAEGGFDLIVGNYGRVRGEGFLNAPLSDSIALRIAGAIERRDGFLESVVTPDADLQDKNENYFRGALKIAPASLDNRLEILLRGSYYWREGAGFNAANAKVIGVAVDPSLVTPPGGSVVFNGQTYTFTGAAPGLGGFNGLNPGTGTLFPFTNAFRDNIPDVNGADVGVPVTGPYESPYDATPFEDLTQQQYSGTINYELSDSILLRSITSFTKFDTIAGGDGDGAAIALRYFTQGTRSETFTQEFQIQSIDTSSRLQYTLGAFYLNESARDGTSFYYLNRDYATATAAARGLPVYYGGIGGFGASNGCQFSFTTPPTSCSLDFTTGNLFDSRTVSDAQTKSYAIYGQGSFEVTDRLTLTAGLRYTIDDKQFKTIAQTGFSDPATVFAGQFAASQGFANPNNYYAVNPFFSFDFNETCGGVTSQGISTNQSDQAVATVPNYFQTLCGERKFKFLTWRAAIDYELTPDNLIYASYSRGAHSGGFGAGLTAANTPGLITTFDEETVDAFEIGSKNTFLDGKLRFNIAAFYYDFKDLQEQGTQAVQVEPTPAPPTNVTTIFNVAGQETIGFEADAMFEPFEGLTLNAAVVYQRARYDEFARFAPANFICFYISSPACAPGTSFPPTAPQNYGIGGGYFPNAQTNPELFVDTGISNFNFAYVPTDRRVQNTPDWSGQLGAAYKIELGSAGSLTPQVNTQWSGKYLLSPSAPNIEQQSYFKTDARITWESENGRLSAQAFVHNIEDEATLGRITVRANGEIQGTYADPRTYGFRLGYRF